MKTLVIGVVRREGTSGRTGAQYSMTQLLVGSPMRPSASPKMAVSCAGFEVTAMDIEDDAFVSALQLRYPAIYEVQTDVRPSYGKMVPVVVAVSPVEVAK